MKKTAPRSRRVAVKKSRKPAPKRQGRTLRAVPAARARKERPAGPPDLLRDLREQHKKEEGVLLKASFETNDWSLAKTARSLGCRTTSLQRAVHRHPELEEERAKWQVTRWGSLKRDAA